VSENSLLWRIFGPKREEVTRCWRNLYNKELHNLYAYSLLDVIKVFKSKRMRCTERVVCIGKVRDEYKILVGKLERRSLRRLRHRREGTIKMNLEK
jgi:hypothetical protein